MRSASWPCLDLEIVDVGPPVATGVLGAVVIAIWRRPPTQAAVTRAIAAFERAVARMTGPFAYLVIIEATSPAPDEAVRARIEAFLDGLPGLTATVAVFEGQPAWLAAALDVALQITSQRPGRAPTRRTKLCVDAHEGICWLSRQRGPVSTDAPRLEQAVESLRASLPPT